MVFLGQVMGAVLAVLTVGIGDQQPSAYEDARLRSLDLSVARIFVPWDVATSDPQSVQAWLGAVKAAGIEPHVAFEHLRGEQCPASPCRAPSRAEYARAVRTFLARFPQVRTFTTWNEANHVSQPTASRPELVAGYYEELRGACTRCTVVAGDVVDAGSYVRWLRRFRAAASPEPRLWGLHNYGDVTYGTTSGTDAALAAVPGSLWLEETGGIVVRRDRTGRELLSADEARAARGIDRAFGIARARSRITRMYVYQWRAGPAATFDSGLVRPDGTTRPSYDAFVRRLAALPKARSSSTVWTARWLSRRRGTLRLRAACSAPARRCRGRVTISVRTAAGWSRPLRGTRVAVRSYRTGTSGPVAVLRVRMPPALLRRLRRAARRRLLLTVRSASPAGARERLVLRLARPA